MTTTGIFDGCHSNLIDATWSKLNEFVPQLQAELDPAAVPSSSSEQLDQLSADVAAATEQKASNHGKLNVLPVEAFQLCRFFIECCYSSSITLPE